MSKIKPPPFFSEKGVDSCSDIFLRRRGWGRGSEAYFHFNYVNLINLNWIQQWCIYTNYISLNPGGEGGWSTYVNLSLITMITNKHLNTYPRLNHNDVIFESLKNTMRTFLKYSVHPFYIARLPPPSPCYK